MKPPLNITFKIDINLNNKHVHGSTSYITIVQKLFFVAIWNGFLGVEKRYIVTVCSDQITVCYFCMCSDVTATLLLFLYKYNDYSAENISNKLNQGIYLFTYHMLEIKIFFFLQYKKNKSCFSVLWYEPNFMFHIDPF